MIKKEKELALYAFRSALLGEMRRRGDSPEAFAYYLQKEKREDAVSAATLRRWRKFKNQDEKEGSFTLIGQPRPGNKRTVRDEILLFAFQQLVHTPKRKLRGIYKDTGDWAKPFKYPVSSYATFRRYMREGMGELSERLVLGHKAFFEKHGLVVHRPDGNSNDLWVTDACELKLYVVDLMGNVFRPSIIVFMDHSSRMIMGWSMTPGAATSDDVLAALKKAILPKTTQGVHWCGKPRVIHSDNGGPFKSDLVQANLTRLGIEPDYSIPACPMDNARVERLFKTVKEDFVAGFEQKLRGKFVSEDGHKPQALWERVPQLFEQWVMEYNLTRVHSVLKMTPYEAWQERLVDTSLINLDWKQVEKSILVERTYKVGNRGVELSPGQYWWSAKLVGLRRRNITVHMPPEGPLSTVQAFLQQTDLGLLTRQGDNAGLAEIIKKTCTTREHDLQKLQSVLKTGSVRYRKVLGQLPRKKKSTRKKSKSLQSQRPKPGSLPTSIKATQIKKAGAQ